MALLQLSILHGDVAMYNRTYQEFAKIGDNTALSIVTANTFESLNKMITARPNSQSYMKFSLSDFTLHVKRVLIKEKDKKNDHLLVCIIEDKNINQKELEPLMEKIIRLFLKDYGEKIKELTRYEKNIPEFDDEVDRILGKMTKKSYLTFHEIWNVPRMKKKAF
ncbi:MAG: hypothetical protein ACTSVI_11200 [Promethearchaeota archaeon]